MITRYLDGTPVPEHMRNLKFVPWPLPKLPSLDALISRHDVNDPATWGTTGGFVSNERFATHGERVIKRSNRETTRKWYDLGRK